MPYEDVKTGSIYAIRHKPTGLLLRMHPKGFGHSQMDIIDEKLMRPSAPRLFTSERQAKQALLMWLRGKHRQEWEDGIQVYTPKTPRIKEEMEIIEVELKQYVPI